jgi:coenzyme F420-dependent glucose-6-phosphate dehydrogenase
MEIGYAVSSEEHAPLDLVRNAARAEEAGFSFALVSDHFHPWIDRQGHSAFVWSVLGALAERTSSATTAAMLPGRFFLGVGTGENLNEHVLGGRWPSARERREMLAEAIDVMRLLWEGDLCSFEGKHYRVENARVYTLPAEPIPVLVAAGGPEAAKLAARKGDGLVSTSPERQLLDAYRDEGGSGPTYGMVTVCFAEKEEDARATALEWWPNAGLRGTLGQELPLPSHFEQAAEMVDEEAIAEAVVCGPDPEAHLAGIRRFADAGFDHVYVHQVGPDQAGFVDFYEREILGEAARLEPAEPRVAA